MLNKFSIYTFSLLAGLSCAVVAADAPDPDLPQPMDAGVGDALLGASPFTRTLDFSDALTLTGVAYIEGKPVATIKENATKRSYVVSEEVNEKGWKLAETDASSQIRQTQVKLQVGDEVFTVRYGGQQIEPTAGKKGSASSKGGPPSGQPSTVNGVTYFKSSSLLAPEDYERYRGYSDATRDKFKSIIKERTEKLMSYTPEQRTAYAKKILDAVGKSEPAAKRK